MPRVVICGTYPTQFNGYSKVLFELVRDLAKYEDMHVFVFGFQNYYDNPSHGKERELPANVEVYDAYKNESPKKKGFGEELIEGYVKEKKPDVVIVYNDLVVLSTFLERLHRIPDRTFKIVPYIDLVYRNEKNNLITYIHDRCDAGIMFTKHWESTIKTQGFTKPTHILEHGFNAFNNYPIPKKVARTYFNLPEKDFIIANLNRNQPRKRWDVCIMAFTKFISRHVGEPVKLVIATATTGAWDLLDVFVSECRKYDLNPEIAKQHIIIVQNPQMLTDREINILYNASDVGINTCDGEGFGLCNFEQAGVGIPQIVPEIGGFKDFFAPDRAMLVKPKWSYYVDSTRDTVGGEAEMCDVDDYVDALEQYYGNSDLREAHGKAARNHIVQSYQWSVLGARLRDIIKLYSPSTPVAPIAGKLDTITEDPVEERNVDVTKLAQPKPIAREHPIAASAPAPAPTPASTQASKRPVFKQMQVVDNTTTNAPAQDKDSDDDDGDIESMTIEEMRALKKKLAKMLKKAEA